MSADAYAANLYAYASAGRRVVAAVIDMVALAAVTAAAYLCGGRDWRLAAVCAATFALMQWGWEGTRGRTVGKAVTGLRAVRDVPAATRADAGLLPPGLARAAVRDLVEAVAACVALVGVILLELTALTGGPRRRAWHDRLSGTAVVDTSEAVIRPGAGDDAVADGSGSIAIAGTGTVGAAVLAGTGTGSGHDSSSGPGSGLGTGTGFTRPFGSPVPAMPPAPDGPHATLHFENGDGRPLPIPARALLGRHPSGDGSDALPIAVPDTTGTMSRTHALLELEGERMWVTDLNSTNGTEIVGEDGPERLESGVRREVPFGTRIILGSTALSVTLTRGRGTAAAINGQSADINGRERQ